MITRQRKQTPVRRLWMPVVTAAFLGYFGFHAFNGSYGLRAMDRIEREGTELTLRLGYLKTERRKLERRIAAVRPEGLDPEVVDVAARTQLNLMRPDEVVLKRGALQ